MRWRLRLVTVFGILLCLAGCAGTTMPGPARAVIVDICEPTDGNVCVKVVRPNDLEPLPEVSVFYVGTEGIRSAMRVTNRDGIAQLAVPPAASGGWVVASRENIISGVLWFPENRKYFIVLCGAAMP
jgi:hypothetical protein